MPNLKPMWRIQMLICPVCRSQNMDTAKFCGNCGNPFPRSSDPTASLINCPQGHIYSAVYQHCPYCPQSERSDPSSFITRIEEQVTAIDVPTVVGGQSSSSQMDFATRIGPSETLFETSESPVLPQTGAVASPSGISSTEVMSTIPSYESIVDSMRTIEPTVEEVTVPVELSSSEKLYAKPNQVGDPELQLISNDVLGSSSLQPVPTDPAPSSALDADRRTIIMDEQMNQSRAVKGRIMGWLVSYTRNPDGEDFRIYAGYNRIGANPICDIVLQDETVSGSHAILVCREGRCLIKDDLSRNGTYVNGREITEAYQLQNYDQVRVGNTVMTYISAQRPS
jgi:hypothetical protein